MWVMLTVMPNGTIEYGDPVKSSFECHEMKAKPSPGRTSCQRVLIGKKKIDK